MINLTEISCGSHDDCPADYPFCYDGLCDLCSECHYCHDGIDGTCGSCGDGYPTKERKDCTGASETTASTTDSGAQSEGMLDFKNIEGIGAMIGSASDNVVVTVTAKDLLILGLAMVNVLTLIILICRCTKNWNGNGKKTKYDFEAVPLSENESLQN